MTADIKIEVLEYIDEAGRTYYIERLERMLPVSEIDHDDVYKTGCEVCEKYGKNLACPPFSPSLSAYSNNAETARVICLRMPQEYFSHLASEDKYLTCFRKVRSLLVEILLDYRKRGYIVAGSGTCLECDQCAAELNSAKCKKPTKIIYSLESLGTNLITLVKTCFGIDLEWSSNEQHADFVCAVGAVFYEVK